MFLLFLLTSVVIFTGLVIYSLIQKRAIPFNKENLKKQESTVFDTSKRTIDSKSTNPEPSPDPVFALEDAINSTIADGKLSKNEEVMLRERALQIGKDPDELIQQLREDIFGLENMEDEANDSEVHAGLSFEKYVVQRLNPRFFRLDYWAGDKFIATRYSKKELDPDIQVTLNTPQGRFPFAIECKWRSRKKGDYIWFSEDRQLKNYQGFAKKTGRPTFIALGLGGYPNDPAEVYLIPISAFNRGTQHHASLAHYRKPNPEQGFFFDVESGELM